MQNKRYLVLSLAIMLVALARLMPHPPNFTPVLAVALFGGALLPGRLAFVVPLAAMLISDLWLGLHSQLLPVYASFVAVVLLGTRLRTRRGALPVVVSALAGSLLFFVVTNFGVWLLDGLYPLTATGLLACYVAALPFFQYSLAGDLFYTALLFGAYAVAVRRVGWLAGAGAWQAWRSGAIA